MCLYKEKLPAKYILHAVIVSSLEEKKKKRLNKSVVL